jgi:hypothetical protein
MLSRELYISSDPELQADHERAVILANRYNLASPLAKDRDERHKIFKDLVPHQGSGCYFEPPFRCDYGIHIELGLPLADRLLLLILR